MLRGKVALVTGATSGLGLAIAKSMAKHGAHVAINGFGDVDKALHEIEASKGYQNAQIHYESADMRKVPEIEGMIRNIETKFSSPEVENGGDGIDILVNCAGIQHVSPIEDFPIEKWNGVIAINLTSAYHTTRLTLPYMKTKNWGRIINIASTHGLVGSAMKSAYVASKHGMVGLVSHCTIIIIIIIILSSCFLLD
jgi:3-hydroxybutyrate dehydrogenase